MTICYWENDGVYRVYISRGHWPRINSLPTECDWIVPGTYDEDENAR